MNSYLKIAIVVIAFVVGFFLGRKTIDVEEKIKADTWYHLVDGELKEYQD